MKNTQVVITTMRN